MPNECRRRRAAGGLDWMYLAWVGLGLVLVFLGGGGPGCEGVSEERTKSEGGSDGG